MRSTKPLVIAIALCLCATALYAQNQAAAYLGQTPPLTTPVLFAPGIVSVPGRYAFDICWSRDGKECFFTVHNAPWSSYEIMTTRYADGKWTAPVRAPFSNSVSMSPWLADNDQTVYFCRGQDIWKAARTREGWSDPEKVADQINSSQPEYTAQISSRGNAWICSHRAGGLGGCDLWRIAAKDGKFTEAANIRLLNTAGNDCGPVPGPDEAYLLWYSDRADGAGKSDIYISYPDGQGGWKAPENLGPLFNTAANENAPTLSPDFKYVFFSRENDQGSDIYWVSVKAFLSDKKVPAKK